MNQKGRRTVIKVFVMSHFSNCPLIWMFHSRNIEHHLNKIHEGALKFVYSDTPNLSFDELLVKDKSVSIHLRNLQLFVTEISKVRNGIIPELMNDIFQFVKKPYNLRNTSILDRKRTIMVYDGNEALSSLTPKIQKLLPNSLKGETSLAVFKNKIKTWTTNQCLC